MDSTETGLSFNFNKDEGKHGNKHESKLEQRRKHFLKEPDAEDLKRKRDNQNVALRKQTKKAKFAKRRNLGQTDNVSRAEEGKFTIEQAESMWQEGMDLMDYFQILLKVDFELPHFLFLIELICTKEDHKILFGIVGLRRLLSMIENPPIQNVIDANLLPLLFSLIGRIDFPRLQFEVLW